MKKNQTYCFFLVGLFIVFFAQSTFARNELTSFRYGEKFVRIGDSQYDVITKIGGPVYVEKSHLGEVWVYEAQFRYFLTFQNSRLQRIQIGGRVQ